MGLLDRDETKSGKARARDKSPSVKPEYTTVGDATNPGDPGDPLWTMWERFYGSPPGSIRPTGI